MGIICFCSNQRQLKQCGSWGLRSSAGSSLASLRINSDFWLGLSLGVEACCWVEHLHIVSMSGLPHNMAAGFQGSASQERDSQVDSVLPFMTLPQKSCSPGFCAFCLLRLSYRPTPTILQGKEIDSTSGWGRGKVVEENVRLEIWPWPLLKDTVCHRP